jgi:hypothetical protein
MATLAARIQRTERRLAQRQAEPVLVYMGPIFFARNKLGFQPDRWQEQVLQSESKRLLLNCCRQSGKSTTSALLSLHQALFFPRSLILLISPSLRQSSELFRKVTDLLALLPVRPALTEDNKLSLRLQNGSRIVSLPSTESTVRGFSGASLIIEDEASRVTDNLHFACKPMLAVSNGRLILMSTPFGKRGHFFEAWENGGPTWERIHVTACDCPRISAEFLAEEKASMPEAWFLAEYMGIFTDTADSVFSYEHVMNALDSDLHPLFNDSPEDFSPYLAR